MWMPLKLAAWGCALLLAPTLTRGCARGAPAPPPGDSNAPVSPLYVEGCEPDVAFADDGAVVQVYEERPDWLYYRVGKVHGPYILWGESRLFATGREPSVALATAVGPGMVVVV
jgi:hypothetical protein